MVSRVQSLLDTRGLVKTAKTEGDGWCRGLDNSNYKCVYGVYSLKVSQSFKVTTDFAVFSVLTSVRGSSWTLKD
jgi:hypothetical protein